jgi:peroxiredoxin
MLFLRSALIVLLVLLSGCKDVFNDINPSGTDRSGTFDSSTTGYHPGEVALDFAVSDTLDNTYSLSAELVGSNGIVLYFTMWCPVCDSHMSHMRRNIMPLFPAVDFYFVDYVSGVVSYARRAQQENGYTTSNVLVDDSNHILTNLYNATMGTTIVIDANGIVQMNEDFKDGSKLVDVLNALP